MAGVEVKCQTKGWHGAPGKWRVCELEAAWDSPGPTQVTDRKGRSVSAGPGAVASHVGLLWESPDGIQIQTRGVIRVGEERFEVVLEQGPC